MYFHLDCLCLAVHACALFSGLPDAQGWIQHVWDHVERPSFQECLPKPDVSLLSWSSVDALRCILPSGLYLVLHQFSALHSYTPHKLQSHRGLTPGWGPAGLWGAHKPSLSLLAQPEAQPRAAGSPQLSLSTQPWGFGQEQEPPALFVKVLLQWWPKELCQSCWGLCLPQARLFHSSLPGISELGHVTAISCCLTPANSEGYHSTSVCVVYW